MHRYPQSALPWLAVLAAVGSTAVAGCSSGGQGTPSSTSASTTHTTEESLTPLPPEGPPPPGAIGVSPGGVTTKVDVPAESTEEQYAKACHAARVWMDGQQGVAHTLIEPYLKTVQTDGSSGPGTFNKPWGQLTAGQQAAVIVAVQAAADQGC